MKLLEGIPILRYFWNFNEQVEALCRIPCTRAYFLRFGKKSKKLDPDTLVYSDFQSLLKIWCHQTNSVDICASLAITIQQIEVYPRVFPNGVDMNLEVSESCFPRLKIYPKSQSPDTKGGNPKYFDDLSSISHFLEPIWTSFWIFFLTPEGPEMELLKGTQLLPYFSDFVKK